MGLGFVFSPDGKVLAARDSDKAIHLWEVGSSRDVRKFVGDSEDYAPLAFSRDGKLLAVAAGDKMIRLWNVVTGEEAGRVRGFETLPGPSVFSADAKMLYTLARIPKQLGGSVFVSDLSAGKIIRHFKATPEGRFSLPIFTH